MYQKVARYLRGRALIQAQGDHLPLFMNLAIQRGIHFYNSKKKQDLLTAEIAVEDYSSLRQLAKEADVRLSLRAKYGFPFVAQRWRKRKGLLVGFLIIFLALVLLGQFVFTVSVEGNERVSTEQILQEAAELGVKPWVYHQELDLDAISKKIQEGNPDLVWATIDKRGTHLTIRVVEKTLPQKVIFSGDLIAAKTGFVDEVIVIQGVPVVKEGQMVKEGQVLIKAAKGMMEYIFDAEGRNKATEKAADAPAAKGFVRGRVWYSEEKPVLLEEELQQQTGNRANGWGIKIRERVIMITNQDSPYAQFLEERQTYQLPAWRNWRFPVEVMKVEYEEIKQTLIRRTVEEARANAQAQAKEVLSKRIPEEAKVLQERVRIRTSGQGVEFVRLEMETFEELAVYRP